MQLTTPSHPIEFDVDYPDRRLDRVSTLFRPLFAVPILVVLALLSGPGRGGGDDDGALFLIGLSSGLIVVPPLLTIVFREKYPRWWFDFNLAFMRFDSRVMSYLLLRDEFPSTDDEQSVHLEVPYPDVRTDLNRWMPLVKWFLAIPHYLVLLVLDIGVVLAAVAAWVAIVATGRYPERLFNYVVGVIRWHNRVVGYAFTLATDSYPPFRLSA